MEINGNLKKQNEERASTLYVLKGLAIISVSAAHFGGDQNDISNQITALISTFGVLIFMLLSGFFFNYAAGIKVFWKKKVCRIIIPWLIWGTITFMFSCIDNNGGRFIFYDYIRWMTGYKTWLYFVVVLLILAKRIKIRQQLFYLL